jgi:hypothetical protein
MYNSKITHTMKVYHIAIFGNHANDNKADVIIATSKKIAHQRIADAFDMSPKQIMSYSSFCKCMKQLDAMQKSLIEFVNSKKLVVVECFFDDRFVDQSNADKIRIDLTSKL